MRKEETKMVHFRLCKNCVKVFRTSGKYCKVCDDCKVISVMEGSEKRRIQRLKQNERINDAKQTN